MNDWRQAGLNTPLIFRNSDSGSFRNELKIMIKMNEWKFVHWFEPDIMEDEFLEFLERRYHKSS